MNRSQLQLLDCGDSLREPNAQVTGRSATLRLFRPYFVVGLLFCLRAYAADQIEVRGGKAIVGKILSESPVEVVVQTQSGPVTVAVNRIAGVRYDGQGATMTQARILEDAYQLNRTVEEYARAQGELHDKPLVLTAARFGEARALALLALDEAIEVDAAIDKMRDYLARHSDSRQYYAAREFLGRLYLLKQDYKAAAAEFEELAKAPWPEAQRGAVVYQSRLARAQNNLDEAIRDLEDVAAAEPQTPEESMVQCEALLEIAACRRSQGRHDDEIAALEKVVAHYDTNQSASQAEAYLALGEAYRATRKPKEALFAILHVDLLFASHKELHARALYNLVQLWNELGHAERATAALKALKSEYPNSPWTKKLDH